MATGKLLQFDATRGYGFVTADDGGEDIFLHASVFDGDASELFPGLELEFQVMASDRGRKAYAAHLAQESSSFPARQVVPVQPARTDPLADDMHMCDSLSEATFCTELTELLLETIPALTGPQIKEVRLGVVDL